MSQEASVTQGAEVLDEYDHWRQLEPCWQREYSEDKKTESPMNKALAVAVVSPPKPLAIGHRRAYYVHLQPRL